MRVLAAALVACLGCSPSAVAAPRLQEGTAAKPAAKKTRPTSYKDYERKPVVLSEKEVDELRAEVLARCQLKPETKPQEAPWFFHYEMGRDLQKRGDPQRALDSLIEAATQRADPAHGARIYGMWFLDYLPYYEIARAHARLGNWDCAENALEYSRRAKEVTERDKEFAEFKALARETESKLKKP